MKPSAPKPSQKFQILIIDDDNARAQLLLTNMSALEMECRHASNGALGLQAFYEALPHLVLLDVMMPGLSGYEVCERIRENSTVPIILMNENLTDENVMKGLKIGADDYILKSMHEQVLSARVIAWLRRVYQYDRPESVISPLDKVRNAASASASAEPLPRAASGPSSELARTQINPPAGWLRCDSCGYMGPRVKFQGGGARPNDLHCPACHAPIVTSHSLL